MVVLGGVAVSYERGTPVALVNLKNSQLQIDSGLREQKMLKGHLPRVVYHQVY